MSPVSHQDRSLFERADADVEAFWAKEAESLSWYRKWDTVLEWDPPFAKWFNGGQLNVSYNCLDRHVEAGRGDKIAYYWEGEPGDRREITYKQLLDEVCQARTPSRSSEWRVGTESPSTCR